MGYNYYDSLILISYFSKSIIVTKHLIIELGLKNFKEGNW